MLSVDRGSTLERAVVLSKSKSISQKDIQLDQPAGGDYLYERLTENYPSLKDIERNYIQEVLTHTKNKKDSTAKILGINRRTLYRKERLYHLS